MRAPEEMRPGNRHARPRPRTLRDVAAAKAALQVTCRRCHHRAVLLPIDLAERLGADFQVDRLAGRLRCEGCRGRAMATVLELVRDGR
jgi:hypothetical protein